MLIFFVDPGKSGNQPKRYMKADEIKIKHKIVVDKCIKHMIYCA
jgi:hypothetical protein